MRVPAGRIILGASLLALGAWAWWPLPEPTVEIQNADAGVRAATGPAPASFDLDAFRAPMWVAPLAPPTPPPPPKAAPPAPPPPVKLQLLAIVREPAGVSTSLKALLYDPDQDRLVLVAAGETVGAVTVQRVLDGSVELEVRGGAGVRTLALRPDEASTTGGGR